MGHTFYPAMRANVFSPVMRGDAHDGLEYALLLSSSYRWNELMFFVGRVEWRDAKKGAHCTRPRRDALPAER